MTHDIKAAVQQQFHQVAANYRTSSVHARGVDLAEMVAAAQPRGHERVLDAGCGTGHTALTFAPHVASVVGVDFTGAMLDQARRLADERGLHNVEFRLGDVEQLPFTRSEFDLVVSRYSAHHWPHPQRALAEFRRVLRPGGRLILSDIVSFDSFVIDTFVQAIELLRDPSHVRDHTVAQWLSLFAGAGFAAEVVFTWGLRLDFADWVARMRTPDVNVAAIHSLMATAPTDVRTAILFEEDGSFTFQGALFRAQQQP
jgi:ubiquinone/menaquinone biosynthesis C-methylase UbiE